MTCAVYYHMSASGEHLYVGCSANPCQRTVIHSSASPWFRDVASIDIKWCADRKAALAFERDEIKRLKPKYNYKPGGNRNLRSPNYGYLALNRWMAEHGVEDGRMASALSSTTASVRAMRTRVCHPQRAKQIAISIATSGWVQPDVWDAETPCDALARYQSVDADAAREELHRHLARYRGNAFRKCLRHAYPVLPTPTNSAKAGAS